MELSEEFEISAPRSKVYEALNDVDTLKYCIPGCTELVRGEDGALLAKVVLKIGPVKATFAGEVYIDNANGPSSMSLEGKGSGGVAGFANGGATVDLVENAECTTLRYVTKVNVGGKLARLGSRLIVSTARKLSAQFFSNLKVAITEATDV